MPARNLLRLRMRHFQRRDLLQMVVQQPGMVDQGLQDQAPRGCDMALRWPRMIGARRELGTGDLVGAGG